MSDARKARATQLLQLAQGGDAAAADELLPLVYRELRAVAGNLFREERAEHTLQPTALVHEAYVRLIEHDGAPAGSEDGRAAFVRYAARVMRNLLIDHARARDAQKRGGKNQRVTLVDEAMPQIGRNVDALLLADALQTLEKQNERLARVAELRFFGGLSVAEAAPVLGVSLTTAKDDWALAKAKLARMLG